MSSMPADRCKVPNAFWQAIASIGVSPPSLLRQARLPSTLHLTGQALVTTAHYFALWRALEDLTKDPTLGIKLVEKATTAAHPPSLLVAYYARDYRDGLQRIVRFKRLCTPEQLSFVEKKSECSIGVGWLYATEPEPAIATDITFASLVELGRRGSGHRVIPLRIELTRARPKGAYHRDYFGCPIRYGAPRNVLVLNSSDLDRPFPGHNPELLQMLTPALASALGELEAGSSMSEQVKAVLKRNLAAGRPDLSDVARDVGVSERTLQRRITEEGTTFRELLAVARQELGRRLLADPLTDIDEVACLLGFQDASSFYRAFRDREGVTPSRWRELNLRNRVLRSGAGHLQ